MRDIVIRYASIHDHADVEAIFQEVHQLHVALRPDSYQPRETLRRWKNCSRRWRKKTSWWRTGMVRSSASSIIRKGAGKSPPR